MTGQEVKMVNERSLPVNTNPFQKIESDMMLKEKSVKTPDNSRMVNNFNMLGEETIINDIF